jgi:flagellar biosynthesis protein FliR
MNLAPNLAVAAYVGLVLARVAAFVAVMPMFASRTPKSVRAALTVVLVAFFLVHVTPNWDRHIAGQASEVHWLAYTLAMLREVLLGGAMGFAFNLFMLPPRIAGEFLTQQIGLAVSPQAGPTGELPAGPLTLVLETTAALVFFQLDGHHIVIATLNASFSKIPLGGTFLPEMAGPALNGLNQSYEMGLLLAGPLGLCLMMLAVVLAIMTRAAPQLNIYSVGFTLQVFVALAGSLYLMPDVINLMATHVGRVNEIVMRFLGSV